MTPSSIRIADPTPTDLDAVLDLQRRSFGPLPEVWQDIWRRQCETAIKERRLIGAYDGSRLVAQALLRNFRQYWGGGELPMAGIAAVGVAPEDRGRGVASLLMGEAVRRAAELGDVVSALYPAAVTLYRRQGWELAGAQHQVLIDPARLRFPGSDPVPVRRATEDDVDAMIDHVRRHWAAIGASGPKALEADTFQRHLADPGTFCYLADGGLLIYHWKDGDLAVDHLTARAQATLQTLWSIVGSGSSIAKSVRAYLGPRDPLHLLLGDGASGDTHVERWMLRLIDAPAAIARRGYPPSAQVDLPLTVADPLAPTCGGSWRLRVNDGSGSLERTTGADDDLRLGPNGLAAMYAGTPLVTLRASGLATGGRPEDDRRLDEAFAADPYLLEYF